MAYARRDDRARTDMQRWMKAQDASSADGRMECDVVAALVQGDVVELAINRAVLTRAMR